MIPPLTTILSGKQIECIYHNGQVLLVRCTNGFEVKIAWLDDDGKPVDGSPHIVGQGIHIHANCANVQAKVHRVDGG